LVAGFGGAKTIIILKHKHMNKKFTFAKIENKIIAVKEHDYLTLTIVVPALNIQKMKDLTGCSILSKEFTTLSSNHNAGKLFKVKIRVKFKNIEKYLLEENIYMQGNNVAPAVNVAEYLNIIGRKCGNTYYSDDNLITSKCALYAFGNCSKHWSSFRGSNVSNVHYFGRNGSKISLIKKMNEITRYVKFKEQWMSNRNF
jgi:hypothetical protein